MDTKVIYDTDLKKKIGRKLDFLFRIAENG
jgi:hypothetical protein